MSTEHAFVCPQCGAGKVHIVFGTPDDKIVCAACGKEGVQKDFTPKKDAPH